jgi:hypothetical protein
MRRSTKRKKNEPEAPSPFIEIELFNEYAFTSGTALEGCIHLHIAEDNFKNVERVTI